MKTGDIIDNKYRIESQIGEGGMGRVVAATHLQLGSTVAIKLLKKDALSHPEVPHRFMREARNASRLRNDHVVRVTDVGQLASGEPYMVMEMLHGYDLATRLTKGALEPARAVEYIAQACEGLAEAHAIGMIHRDVKPANLFVVTRPNGTPLVKVLDFGIATAAIGDVDHRLTTTQSVIGSPSYMSPEQLRATRDVDVRSDIWSLGVTLYELLADRQPFIAPTITALSLKIVSDPHPPIEDIPLELMAILDRCLEKDRTKRFSDVAELASVLAPLFPNGKLAAEMVSGVLSQPVPPTLPSAEISESRVIEPDPGAALGMKVVSNPSLTTAGFAAGESAVSVIGTRKKRRVWIPLIAAAAAGGLATAAVIGFRADDNKPVPAAAPQPAPPTITTVPVPIMTPPPPPPVVEEPIKAAISPPVVEPPVDKKKKKRSKKSSTTTTGPVTKPDPVVVTQPPPPKIDPPPPKVDPPPKKPTPCLPSDKTCGL